MTPVATVAEVFDAIQRAKGKASAFCTNFFPVEKKLEDWIRNRELHAELRGDAAFFFRRDRDFRHLYFCAGNVASLQRDLNDLPRLHEEPLTVDLIGKEAVLAEMTGALESAGFRHYTRLQRMARPGQTVIPEAADAGPQIICAEKADRPAILDLLESAFDKYADQLPTANEVDEAIAAGQILIVKQDGMPAALLFFETQGFTSSVRYWVVGEKFRSHRLGAGLMRHYLSSQRGVKRFVLWVGVNNANAIQKYQHFGYAADGLLDEVMANKMIQE